MNTHAISKMLFSLAIGLALATSATAAEKAQWNDYLDFAYIYSSADSAILSQRLAGYICLLSTNGIHKITHEINVALHVITNFWRVCIAMSYHIDGVNMKMLCVGLYIF